MNCIEEINCGTRVIIGIRDYEVCNKPESNLFLNDYPGITLKSAANIVGEQDCSGLELLRTITKNAVRLVVNDFQNEISSAFDFNAIIETRQLYQFDNTTIPKAAKERGLVLKRWRSEMAKIYIEDIIVKSKQSGVLNVKIIDGTKITNIEIDLIADKAITKRVDYVAQSEEVSIVADDTNFDMYSGTIFNNSNSSCCGSSSNTGLLVYGWNGEKETNKYYGIGVNVSARCYEENIICKLLPRMYFLIWYKCAALYFEECIATDRMSVVAIFKKDFAIEQLEVAETKYQEAWKSFVPTIKRFLNSTKGECITCNTNRYEQRTP